MSVEHIFSLDSFLGNIPSGHSPYRKFSFRRENSLNAHQQYELLLICIYVLCGSPKKPHHALHRVCPSVRMLVCLSHPRLVTAVLEHITNVLTYLRQEQKALKAKIDMKIANLMCNSRPR